MHGGKLLTQIRCFTSCTVTEAEIFQHQPCHLIAVSAANGLRHTYRTRLLDFLETGGFCRKHFKIAGGIQFNKKMPCTIADAIGLIDTTAADRTGFFDLEWCVSCSGNLRADRIPRMHGLVCDQASHLRACSMAVRICSGAVPPV